MQVTHQLVETHTKLVSSDSQRGYNLPSCRRQRRLDNSLLPMGPPYTTIHIQAMIEATDGHDRMSARSVNKGSGTCATVVEATGRGGGRAGVRREERVPFRRVEGILLGSMVG